MTRCAASFRLREVRDDVAVLVHDAVEAPLRHSGRGGGRDADTDGGRRHCDDAATTAVVVRLEKAGGGGDIVGVIAQHAEGGDNNRRGVIAGVDGRRTGGRGHGRRNFCSLFLRSRTRQNESDPQRWAAIVLSVPGPLRDYKLADVFCQKTGLF